MANPTAKPAAKKRLTTAQRQQIMNAAMMQVLAESFASRLGMSYGTDRDLYESLGYKVTPEYVDYEAKAKRHEIGYALVHKPVDETWRMLPTISEAKGEETAFETAWTDLDDKLKVFEVLSRLDALARIGRYGILLMGFDDGADLGLEITHAKTLLYATPYSEATAKISEWERDAKNERFGLPTIYSVSVDCGGTKQTMRVHHSRVIHVAEGRLESNVYGTPALEPVLNRLKDLEMIAGGSAEMFWEGAFPGFSAEALPGATLDKQAKEALEDEFSTFIHKFRRVLRTQNMNVKSLAPQVSDPSPHIDKQIDLICAAAGIPKRILMGSERGELASTEDRNNWADTVMSRQKQHCEPNILRPFVDRLILYGALPTPQETYAVEWPDLKIQTPTDKATVGKTHAEALAVYVSTPGADMVVAPSVFLERELGYTQDELDNNEEALGQRIEEDADGEAGQPDDDGEREADVEGAGVDGGAAGGAGAGADGTVLETA
jgi:hypothetical protein